MAQQKIDLNPGISGVRAIVTTRWGGHGYRPRVINTIEQYTVDSAMDTDADTWSIDISDPYGDLVDTLDRDSEVRVQLFGVGNSPDYLMTGFADTVEFSDDGTLTIAGRDMSSIAMDSEVPPSQFRHVRGWAIVDQQAKALGFQKTRLAKGRMVSKVAHTDGSESYWEFWYRLYRREKMWIWCDPDGTLRADFLNYSGTPNYWIGVPRTDDSARIKSAHIPVETLSVRKNAQTRVAEAYVYYHRGKTGSHEIAIDPTMRAWQKRPRRILLDANARTSKGAMKTGWDEIFEGKVGEIEYTITIPDPSFLLRQNTIARLRLPDLNLAGDFFVVGTSTQAGPDGASQQVRLRDKKMALTRRVPSEPKATGTQGPKDLKVQTSLGIALNEGLPMPWGSFFFNAAKKFHAADAGAGGGPSWDFNLFLACLLALCDQLTNFTNIREPCGHNDRVTWFPFKDPGSIHTPAWYATARSAIEAHSNNPNIQTVPVPGSDRRTWEYIFANDRATVAADGIANRDLGVGPMLISDPDDKRIADNYATTSSVNTGGITAAKLDAYLKGKNSPLSGYGSAMVSEGQKNNVDPRLICAIAGAETTWATDPNAGSDITTGHNAWGLGPHNAYADWPTGIAACAGPSYLGGSLYVGGGNITVAGISQHWAPPNAGNDPGGLNANWTKNVSQFLSEIGGNPNDVTFKSSEDGQAASPQSNSAVNNQYEGGRWSPEANIWAGAKHLRDCLNATGGTGQDDQIWMGVMAYRIGAQAALQYFNQHNNVDSFTKAVRVKVNSDPGYLAQIKTDLGTAMQQAGNPAGVGPDDIYDQPPAPPPGKVNSDAAIEKLTHIQKNDPGVDLNNVDWKLLVRVNNLGAYLGKKIVITSGFRTKAQQIKAWDDMGHNPLLAANPYTTTSNHQIGEAVDCTIGGNPIGLAVPADVIEKFGIHCSVYVQYKTDPVHVTLLGVWH